jgi:hypothetical protein
MENREKTMYRILGAISAMDAPIVFKGALITKLVLSERGYASAERQTKDIDANWVGTPPSMQDLTDAINQALASLDEGFVAVATREYTEGQTAGFLIASAQTGERVVLMDFDIHPVAGSKLYHYGEIGIRGVLPTEILADKVSVLSGRYIFRRAKDIFDVYALAHCVSTTTSEIYDVQRAKEQEIGAFTEFCTRRPDVAHAYEKLRDIEGKPAFDEVYAYLEGFLSPFMLKDETPKVWNIDTSKWDDVLQIVEEKPSVMEQIRAAKAARQVESSLSPKGPRRTDEPEL